MSEIQYRPALEDDIPRLLELHREVYGVARTAEHYRWKYFLPVPGFSVPRLWVAEAEGRLVGSGGALPFHFWVDGKVHVANSLAEFHVLKELRRQRVQTRIHEHLYEGLVAAGVEYTFTLPNQISVHLFPTIQYIPLFRTIWMQIDASGLSASGDRMPPDRSVRRLETPGDECMQLWTHVQTQVNCCSVPEPAWLRYRYVDCPSKTYQFLVAEDDSGPIGLLVLGYRWFGTHCESVVAYCLSRQGDDATLRALIAAAARSTLDSGFAGIRTLVADSPGPQRLWRTLGFGDAPGDFVLVARGKELPASVKSPDEFAPRLGDHDFV